MWKWKIDPDNSSIPYLTALGDLLGSSLLGIAFLFLLYINMEYGDGYYDTEEKDAVAATAAITAAFNVSNWRKNIKKENLNLRISSNNYDRQKLQIKIKQHWTKRGDIF